MRTSLAILALVALMGCSPEQVLQKFSSPEDQATARSYVERLRARNFDEIEKALDPSVRTPNIRETLVKMASLIPNQEPTSVKIVGAQSFSAPDAKTVSTTFEYSFGDRWLLANVAVRESQGVRTVVGFHVKPISQSLEVQNRFTLAGKSTIQYSVLIAAIAAVLLTVYALVVCIKTKFPRRKWLWILFVVIGLGKLAVNWTTGEWGIAPLTVQLFSASAVAPFYGPWIIAVSLPLGAIVFLFFKRKSLEQALRASTAESDARKDVARGLP
ncbi:MAG: hypothetical protein WAU52_14575 [Burkholderiales bacterium]